MAIIGKIAAHSAYDMFSCSKCLIVNLVFPTSVFGAEIFFLLRLFLIVAYFYPFPIFLFCLVTLARKRYFGEKFIYENKIANW